MEGKSNRLRSTSPFDELGENIPIRWVVRLLTGSKECHWSAAGYHETGSSSIAMSAILKALVRPFHTWYSQPMRKAWDWLRTEIPWKTVIGIIIAAAAVIDATESIGETDRDSRQIR
jgi:hypothetical protein